MNKAAMFLGKPYTDYGQDNKWVHLPEELLIPIMIMILLITGLDTFFFLFRDNMLLRWNIKERTKRKLQWRNKNVSINVFSLIKGYKDKFTSVYSETCSAHIYLMKS